ncbi:DNA-binding protein [Rhizobacter sp. J219]|uniref:DNA-binding protein n=1 Tax=Piscinibacter gummiphilus TaxID=946333 RepID=A0ABZ0D140_9BURK|nr:MULTISPECIES: DNA-binding protein [Burkholderiales]MCR5882158.1 DNA-binding protein [Rhizobacter sp. J219]WOB10960.1 DNA-binding protein [Piscinibacter gummiphilus]
MSTENEILAEVESLKARFSETKSLYREVCALLFFRYGITPTTNKLYQYVRKGTMSTPAEALSKFWDELRRKARVEIDHPDLPEELKATAAEAIAGIWHHAIATARGELEVLRIEARAELDEAKRELQEANAAVEEERARNEELASSMRTANETAQSARTELEAERRAHTGTAARLQEVQAQLGQAREQQQRLQDGFSAELAKVRDAVTQADQRAAAAERRALMEVEQERQARAKADKLAEALRGQVAMLEAQERREGLAHAEAVARLQAQVDSLSSAAQHQGATNESLEIQVAQLRDQLQASQQETTRYRAEAETVQALLNRLTPSSAPKAPRQKRTTP